jgi:hypothetical protein
MSHTPTEPASTPASGFRDLFAIDVRSLALSRILLGLLLLTDLAQRAPDLAAHYTDDGVLPRAARLEMQFDFGAAWWASPHMLSGQAWFQGALFALACLLAVCVVVGYRTRLALAGSLVLLLGLQARNPMLLQGHDTLLRCQIFWSLFLPMGAVWSLDRRLGRPSDLRFWICDFGLTRCCNQETVPSIANPKSCGPRRVVSVASAALLLQLCMVYWFTALLKTDPAWRRTFDAAWYAIHFDHFTLPLGYRLAEYPHLLRLLTLGAWLLEFTGPFLVLIPVANGWFRGLAILSFAGFHLGLGLCLDLGLFALVCIGYWLVFLPSGFWDFLERKIGRQSASGAGGRTDRPLRRLRDLSGGTRRRAPGSRPVFIGTFTTNALAGGLLAYVLLLNVARMHQRPYATVFSPAIANAGKLTGLDQHWIMFSPHPPKFGSWFIIRGMQADGQMVDLWHPSEHISDTRPNLVSAMYASVPWRRCLGNMLEHNEPAYIRSLGDYFRRRWDKTHPPMQRLVSAEIVHMVHQTPPPDTPASATIEPQVLYHWTIPSPVAGRSPSSH